ncbi:cellobiose dehydrogenase-like protein [Apiospora saccharicola]|uniref:Cellobiose dehydrogenase-like protein n=1 Tax=Apiospora saccharicola TaxID=335842 RepID=A0ABR1UXQ5_9PEZI
MPFDNWRPNFALMTDTDVRQVVRDGGRATGVEIEGTGRVINVTPGTGRVVLSAGCFVVAGSQTDGATFIDQAQWLRLPVGKNLKDQQVNDFQVSHVSVKNYDWSKDIWTNPVQKDVDQYMKDRSGMLAGPLNNHGPMDDENSEPRPPNNLLTLTSFVGRGSSTVGRLTINSNVGYMKSTPTTPLDRSAKVTTMTYAEIPYFQTEDDKKAALISGERMTAALKLNPDITMVKPAPDQTVVDYVNSVPINVASRRGLHLMGTARMGGVNNTNGEAVVDSNAKVYGTDNLFVVDASILLGMVTANPTGAIFSVAEKAVERILKLSTKG